MDDGDHQPAARGLRLQQPHHDVGVRGGQARCGLVHEQDGRFADQFERDVQPLALAAADGFGQRIAHLEVGDLLLLEFGQHPADALAALGGREPGQAQPGVVVQIFPDGQVFEQQVVLRHGADDAFERGGIPMQIDAVEEHAACLGRQAAVEQLDQRGFAHAAAAHHGDQPPAGLAEGKIFDAGFATREPILDGLGLEPDRREGRGAAERPFDFAAIDRLAARVAQDRAGFERIEPARRDRIVVEGNLAAQGADEIAPGPRTVEHGEFRAPAGAAETPAQALAD